MSMDPVLWVRGPVAVYARDLRPVADAVASRRQTEPPLPVAGPPVAYGAPDPAIRASVVQSAIAAQAVEEDAPRRLKPWGVAMLPHDRPRDESVADGVTGDGVERTAEAEAHEGEGDRDAVVTGRIAAMKEGETG